MKRSLRLLSLIVVATSAVALPALARPTKVAVTQIEGDTTGLDQAVIGALDEGELEIVAGKPVARAIGRLGLGESLLERDVGKLAAELEVDAVVQGAFDHRLHKLRFTIFASGKKGKPFTVAVGDPESERFRKLVRTTLMPRLAKVARASSEVAASDAGDDARPGEAKRRGKNARTDAGPDASPRRGERDEAAERPAKHKARSEAKADDEVAEAADRPAKHKARSEAKADDEAAEAADRPAKHKARSEAKADDAVAEAKTDAKAEAKTDAKAEAKTDAKAEAKTDAKAEAKTGAKADAKTEPNADAEIADADRPARRKARVKIDAKADGAAPDDASTEANNDANAAAESPAPAARAGRARVAARDEEDAAAGSLGARREPGAPGVVHSANLAAVRVDLGAALSARSLQYKAAAFDGAPRPYKNAPAPGAHLEAELYPFAFGDPSSALAGLGVAADYGQTISLSVRPAGQMTAPLKVTDRHYSLGVRYRIAFGHRPTSPTLTLGAGYAVRTFAVDRTGAMATIDLPDVDYRMFDPGLAFRLPLGRRVALTAGGRAMLVTSAGAIQRPDQYGKARVFGGTADAGLELLVTDRVAVRLAADATQLDFAFSGTGTLANSRDGDSSTVEVKGATDRYYGGTATLGVTY